MGALELAKRLLSTSAILVLGGIAISVMTQDEWLTLAHAASLVGGVIAAFAVLLLIATALRRWGMAGTRPPSEGPAEHERGQTGWE